ncbi:MAG: hypothetical protein KME49_19025 [Brasilonema octagenarum HA4186-MV1]|jgi:hypothetical protein|uniref:Membrane-associated sensor domain-containing protein n=1 Tax=Brasilonema octagenarum UFV-OR1 TaxID=417115 RepID=A0ABX1M8F2_9CYAN|nr:MASE3 domain-containing protein [Brasilonema octagenarum]MBW4627534.1 hypothetical protein [Brasilonema octagenarum HA4186-MV1]NMF64803.1 hypothetical protein [Brasilonema octagenarum UFV-OR1]
MRRNRIPVQLVWAVVVICLLPSLLNLLGVDFGSPSQTFDVLVSNITKDKVIDVMHHTLSGSFTHTILEWSAFCTAIFTVILSLIHFYLKADVVTPIIGIALFSSGCMDAFHTLAADRLIQGVADNQNLIPFTWAICRLFNALILLGGAGFFLIAQPVRWKRGISLVVLSSLVFGVIAFWVVSICARSATLPKTIFPNSIVTRPWDIAPLLLFIFAGFVVFPRFYNKYPSLFSHALIISVIPEVATQLHMAFGSKELFDNHFNIAHFLKIIAYLVPFIGLILDYIRTYREEADTAKELKQAMGVFNSILSESR